MLCLSLDVGVVKTVHPFRIASHITKEVICGIKKGGQVRLKGQGTPKLCYCK